MDIRKIDDSLSVSPQIRVEDVAEIARLGFKTLVANRPDREEPGQPSMAEIEAAAKAHGLDWVYLPVASGNITDEDVERFAPMIQGAESPYWPSAGRARAAPSSGRLARHRPCRPRKSSRGPWRRL